MVKSTCNFLHTSSHPDKYNNSVNRIISKEEEREDPRRELQSSFQLESKSVSSVSTCNPTFLQELQVFSHILQSSTLILYTELILPQEILQLQGSSHADYYKASSSDCSPYIQAFYMAEQGSQLRYSTPGPHGTSRLPVNSTWQKQHSKRQPASTQPLQQFPGRLHRNPLGITEILPGEIGFISKGLSIVCPCNTKVSVFQFTY